MYNFLLPIITSVITGGLTLIGVIYTSHKQHDFTVEEIRSEIQLIKKDINDLEEKQDKHNAVIERVYTLETSIQVLNERQNNIIGDVQEMKERN